MPGKPVGTILTRSFYARDSGIVAPDLLNKVLVGKDGRSARIVEVEAYRGAEDAAAHSFRGVTPRTEVMFGNAGHLYVYFTYGMHWCCNAVCGKRNGMAVLLRAAEPLTGLAQMRLARPSAKSDHELCKGPARLTKAFGITGAQNGIDLVKAQQGWAIIDDGVAPPLNSLPSVRIGISKAKGLPLRWSVPGSRFVSGRPGQNSSIKPRTS